MNANPQSRPHPSPELADQVIQLLAEQDRQMAELLAALEETRQPRADQRPDLVARVEQTFSHLQSAQSAISARIAQLAETLGTVMAGPVSLSWFAGLVGGERGDRMMTLRGSLLNKLAQIRSFMIGSKLVLCYSMDFYHRLLSALAGNQLPEPCYSPAGQRESAESAAIITKNC